MHFRYSITIWGRPRTEEAISAELSMPGIVCDLERNLVHIITDNKSGTKCEDNLVHITDGESGTNYEDNYICIEHHI